MGLVSIPCEIYHREFDAKLILSSFLASQFGHTSLIGYDKYFNLLLPKLPAHVLLDKSCSSIIWNGRLKHCKRKGGYVVISDEEGFNNINEANRINFSNRLDTKASKSIDSYCCWGKIDFDFWSKFPSLSEKLLITGNCRSDLLTMFGKQLYSSLSTSLKSLFGDYILISDNFCVERRGGEYSLPAFNVSPESSKAGQINYDQRLSQQKRRRDYFAKLITHSATTFPTKQFVIRPHPCADSRWWANKFVNLRNVHVIYHHNIDPWIHGASCLISMGCTSALQARIANIPIIEINDPEPELDFEKNRGYSHHFASFIASTPQDLVSIIDSLENINNSSFVSSGNLKKFWRYSSNVPTSLVFSKLIHNYVSKLPKSSVNSRLLHESIQCYLSSNEVPINDTKWPHPSFSNILSIFSNINSLIPNSRAKIKEVAPYLYLVHT